MVKNSAQVVQAMPLLEGKVNLASGATEHKVNELIHCATEAVVEIKWDTGTTATITMVNGQDFAFKGTVTITSGSIHIS